MKLISVYIKRVSILFLTIKLCQEDQRCTNASLEPLLPSRNFSAALLRHMWGPPAPSGSKYRSGRMSPNFHHVGATIETGSNPSDILRGRQEAPVPPPDSPVPSTWAPLPSCWGGAAGQRLLQQEAWMRTRHLPASDRGHCRLREGNCPDPRREQGQEQVLWASSQVHLPNSVL